MSFKQNDGLGYIENRYYKENSFIGSKQNMCKLPQYEDIKEKLPMPFWKGHEDVIDGYYKAWKIAFSNLKKATKENGFVNNYIGFTFNDCIFMWDTVFMLFFGKYAKKVFDFQGSLNNFYAKQHRDGFICREISEKNGEDKFFRMDPISTGPNIFAWSEWEYYKHFGDKERLEKVFPVLLGYHRWLREYRTWRDGSYWSSGWGCGMDNIPRLEKGYDVQYSHGHMVWVDTNMQQLFNIQILKKIAHVCGRIDEIGELDKEANILRHTINQLWDDDTSFYYDMWQDGSLNMKKSVAPYWALLAGVVPNDKLEAFVAHLDNEKEFKTKHRIPTLSSDEPEYNPYGEYWRGGVWSPTNYMILCGLKKCGYEKLAYEIALNHVESITEVFKKTDTFWENYAPDHIEQGNISHSDFVGWTGTSAIAVLIEYVFGITVDFDVNKIVWRVNCISEHGINNYPVGNHGIVNLKCNSRKNSGDEPVVEISGSCDMDIEIIWDGGSKIISSKSIEG